MFEGGRAFQGCVDTIVINWRHKGWFSHQLWIRSEPNFVVALWFHILDEGIAMAPPTQSLDLVVVIVVGGTAILLTRCSTGRRRS